MPSGTFGIYGWKRRGMNPRIEERFATIEGMLLASPAVATYQIIRRLIGPTDGKIRLRIELVAGGLIELFEYVVAEQGEPLRVEKYSVHWQRADGVFRKRWDDAPHFPDLDNAPHHIHLADSMVNAASGPPDLAAILLEIEQAGLSGQRV